MRVFKMAVRQARLLLLEAEQARPLQPEPVVEARPEMVCFRGQSLALVRHFFELSCQMGRLPSLLGREFFRAKVSHHSVPSFEDQIVFARDVEICMEQLSDEHAQIITLVGLYDFSHDEVAEMLHCARTSVTEMFPAALDALSEIFLHAGLLSEKRPDRHQHQQSPQPVPRNMGVLGKKPPGSVKFISRNANAGVAHTLRA
jgi:DNA-directed RNA polymerase specialized sigma24 family protein